MSIHSYTAPPTPEYVPFADPDGCESWLPRLNSQSGGNTLNSGILRLVFKRAQRTARVDNLRVICAGAAGVDTTGPELVRAAVYKLAGNEIEMLASSDNDPTLLNTTGVKDFALTSTWDKQAGVVYGLGVLCVTPDDPPETTGSFIADVAESSLAPSIWAEVTSLSDLPATSTINHASFGPQVIALETQ